MNNINTKEDFKDALLSIRNAHRLIKGYQETILNLMFYIKDRYLLSDLRGQRRFCAPLTNYRSGYANIKLWKEMWSWDFIYTYEFEYYFGVDYNRFKDKIFSFSIIQVSDTGFYKSKTTNGNEVEKFEPTENSESVLVFIFEIKKESEDWLWNDEIENTNNELLRNNKEKYLIKNRFLAIKYDLYNFIDKKNTDEILKEFNDEIDKLFKVRLLKDNVT